MGTAERNCRVPYVNRLWGIKTTLRVMSSKLGEDRENIFDLGLGYEMEDIFIKKMRKGQNK